MERIRRVWRARGDTEPRPIPASELPLEVQTTIEAAMVIQRPDGDPEDGPNVVLMIAGIAAFRYSHEEAARWLRMSFPELTEAQVARGIRYFAAKVATHVANEARRHAEEFGHRSWSSWRPLRIPYGEYE